MRAADRIEGGINAGSAPPPCSEIAHRRDEIAGAIVDCGSAIALHHRQVCGRASADGLEAEMPRKIKQRCADNARGAYDQDCAAGQRVSVAGKHLEGGEIGEGDTHRFGGSTPSGTGTRKCAGRIAYWA
jgi:hypothetical protein